MTEAFYAIQQHPPSQAKSELLGRSFDATIERPGCRRPWSSTKAEHDGAWIFCGAKNEKEWFADVCSLQHSMQKRMDIPAILFLFVSHE